MHLWGGSRAGKRVCACAHTHAHTHTRARYRVSPGLPQAELEEPREGSVWERAWTKPKHLTALFMAGGGRKKGGKNTDHLQQMREEGL